ncbi:hypothetical protein, partial [Mameliella sp. LZ-28]|uniref:hypothetical protein n=1 Tax=Mameliella sp. LZ-28 TaxID=2484146 RepID=UPI001B2FEE33
SLLFLDHPDYLRLGETALSHCLLLQCWRRPYITVRDQRGQVKAQKAFILKQGEQGAPVAEICRKAGIS